MRLETLAVHAGFGSDPATGAAVPPIYQTAAYAFDSADHAAALFNLETPGYRYSRIANPTVAVLEERVAALEGGSAAVAFASGQAALAAAFLTLVGPGGAVVAAPELYGATHTLLGDVLAGLGIEARFARTGRPEDVAETLADTRNVRAVFCESVSNPSGAVADLAALAELAHAAGAPLLVDNTVATPALLRPLEHGADFIVHSLTKFMGGHGSTLGGALVDGGRFPFADHAARFPAFTRPDAGYHGLVYARDFPEAPAAARARAVCQRTLGAALSPLSAFLLLQGVETLPLRMARHVETGLRVAEALAADPRVAWVSFAGLPGSPHHALARRYLPLGVPPLLTFGVRGGLEAGKAAYDAFRLIKRLVNIGDARTLACHPASTTHRQMSPEDQARAGVAPEALRLSIGLEHADDLLEDLDQALEAAAAARRRAA